jgi:transcription initiation factor TFIIE subunit alpha
MPEARRTGSQLTSLLLLRAASPDNSLLFRLQQRLIASVPFHPPIHQPFVASLKTLSPVVRQHFCTMAELATLLLRTIARTFYSTEHILIIDTLIQHSTLSDVDLSHLVGMQTKMARKICGRLKEDGLVTIQQRTERRTDGSGGFMSGSGNQPGKERVSHRDWYYINYHTAIDSVKYRLLRLSKHVDSLGASTTEKKDLVCATCKSQYTELEAMDSLDHSTGNFLCRRCGSVLDPVDEEDRANENESVKRFNHQVDPIRGLMMQIDATSVPENDFETALSKHKPVIRADTNPAARTEIVDNPKHNLQSTKGLTLKPEKISVQVQDDETVKRETEEAEAKARRDKEARQNALPEWIMKSTVSGDITAVGAKEAKRQQEREVHLGGVSVTKADEAEDKKGEKDDEDVMAAYWRELKAANEKQAAENKAEDDDDDDDDDDDEFEDVDVTGANTPAVNGSTTVSTPAVESSNATDDERDAKKRKLAPGPSSGNIEPLMSGANGSSTPAAAVAEDTPAASDEDEDDDLEFENV